jgi:hypothetical protein
MSTNPEKPSLLASIADEYEPTDADAKRVLAKLQAALAPTAIVQAAPAQAAPAQATPPASAPLRPSPSQPTASTGVGSAFREGRTPLLLGLSAAAFVVLGSVVMATRETSNTPPPEVVSAAPSALVAPSAPVAPPAPVEPSEVREPQNTAAIPAVSVDSLPSATPAKKTAAAPASAPETGSQSGKELAGPQADTLEREAKILADARRARQSGEGERALALLDEHARLFPKGWLASDRAAERIVVLCDLGRHEQAVREATVFLAGRPKGPLTRRVELSCAGKP